MSWELNFSPKPLWKTYNFVSIVIVIIMRLHSYPSFPVSLISGMCWAVLRCLVVELTNLGLRVVVVEMTNLIWYDMSKRNFEHYIVNRTLTKRYFNSAIPQMQRLLNSDKRKRVEILRKISSYPVNNDFYKSISLR